MTKAILMLSFAEGEKEKKGFPRVSQGMPLDGAQNVQA